MEVPHYEWTERKIKFFIYTVEKNWPNDETKFDKRVTRFEDKGSEDQRDVDLCFLFENYIKLSEKNSYEILHNTSREDLFKHFSELQVDESLKQYDCFFFVYLTHTYIDENWKKQNMALVLSRSKVHIEEVYEEMDKIKYFCNKPKIFLVQADDGSLLAPLVKKSKGVEEPMRIPHRADLLTIMSTIPGKEFASDSDPSFLIQAFVDAMTENGNGDSENQQSDDHTDKQDFLNLTAVINGKVDDQITAWLEKHPDYSMKLELPLVTSTLRRLLYF